jgi:hypothetical protein
MDFRIVEFKINPCEKKIGTILIDYHGLMIRCQLAYYSKGKNIWVRLPEKWIKPDQKLSYCFWPSKEKSDEFQKEVINKIFDMYDLTFEKVVEIHMEACKKRCQ